MKQASPSAEAVSIQSTFKKRFSSDVDAVIVAPGRVNIIGEHVDYMGYSVLPCALNQTTTIAMTVAKPSEKPSDKPFLTLDHCKSKFPQVVFQSIRDCKYDPTKLADAGWSGYVLSALFGILEFVASGRSVKDVGQLVKSAEGVSDDVRDKATKALTALPTSMHFLVDGDVPIAAGVSSSGSLVVASMMAFAKAMNVKMTDKECADVCANAERHSGVASGGMDQASICMSKAGSALLIDFDPLNATTVSLPADARLVVSNTFKVASKLETAGKNYNCRVFECRIAIMIIMKGLGLEVKKEDVHTLSLKKLQNQTKSTFDDMETLIKKYIKTNPYTLSLVEESIGKDMVQALLNTAIGHAVWEKNTSFELYRRVMHVIREAQRVHEFASVCQASTDCENKTSPEDILKKLGELMNQSDESLNCLYACSCPEIVRMTRMARSFGAYGSRLTGAGWGGCCVSLVHKDKVEEFKTKIDEAFYKTVDYPELVPSEASMRVFAVSPGQGARIYSAASFAS